MQSPVPQDPDSASADMVNNESPPPMSEEEQIQNLLTRSQELPKTCIPVHARIFHLFSEILVDESRDQGLYPYQSHVRQMMIENVKLNILVSSPTGSGKSFAIYEAASKAIASNTRLYVGEPLIALVEQVYNNLRCRGIPAVMRTGPSSKGDDDAAHVVVATYEVLARIGHDRGFSDGIYVLLDEVHYLASDRGPVLQEILKSSQDSLCTLVALSGTIPNADDVARCMSMNNGYETKIVGASRRPIELQYYFYDAVQQRFSPLKPERNSRTIPVFESTSMGGIYGKQNMLVFVRELQKWDCLPALLVAFSCRLLNQFAADCDCLDLIHRNEKSIVARSFDKMLQAVPEQDQCLFAWLRPLAIRGIGLHHAHLPVQYLELVSLLASQRCLKLVFSSSTLSAGIDLPVRTVCLLNTRMPRKVGGEMIFERVDPLVCKQLCGRAGRPGQETEGNVVFVGRGSAGYTSALALQMEQIPPIVPYSEFSDGDVLRSLRQHRCIVADRMIFECGAVQKLATVADASHAVLEEAIHLYPDSAKAVESLAALLEVALQTPTTLHSYCIPKADRTLYLIMKQRSVDITENDTPHDSTNCQQILQLTSSTKAHNNRNIPFDCLNDVISKREIFDKIAQHPLLQSDTMSNHQEYSARMQMLSIFMNYSQDRQALKDMPSYYEYSVITSRLEKQGYISAGCLTLRGRAACVIRTCAHPQLVVEALTSFTFTHHEYLAFASLIVGSGKEDSEETHILDQGFEQELRRNMSASAAEFTKATIDWYEGKTLREITTDHDTSVGEFCRHIMRVHDSLVEMKEVYDILGIACPYELPACTDAIERGLPFIRRGGGRVRLDDDAASS